MHEQGENQANRTSWTKILLTVIIAPIVVGIVSYTYEACIDKKIAICVPSQNTSTITEDLSPLLSPYRLAFASIRDGNSEIYLINGDGTNVTRLTNNPADDFYASWSPDGSQLAFTSNRDGDCEIYIMNEDGNGVRQLTYNEAYDCCPDWSPSGDKIAFNSNFPDGDQDIYVIGVDGSSLLNLTNFPGDDRSPKWSPDGTKIAFDARRDGQPEIYFMNSDGSNQVRLTSHFTAQRNPYWSPNGSVLVYDSNQVYEQTDEEGDHDIYLMFIDGTSQREITNDPGEDKFPHWSPDGDYIAYIALSDGNNEIVVMDWVGKQQTHIVADAAEYGGADWRPIP